MTNRKRKKSALPSEPKAKRFSKGAQDAINSEEFKKARNKAEEYARDPGKVRKLVDEALKKTRRKKRGPLGEVWKYLTAIIRLVRAYARRQYTDVPWETIILSIAAIIYFVSPIDFIPDFIPVAGYVDDAAVIAFIAAAIKLDLDNFLEWEAKQDEFEATNTEENEQSGRESWRDNQEQGKTNSN
jgi:uncharacterized membrane protein YkvA (DUF1232 family)